MSPPSALPNMKHVPPATAGWGLLLVCCWGLSWAVSKPCAFSPSSMMPETIPSLLSQSRKTGVCLFPTFCPTPQWESNQAFTHGHSCTRTYKREHVVLSADFRRKGVHFSSSKKHTISFRTAVKTTLMLQLGGQLPAALQAAHLCAPSPSRKTLTPPHTQLCSQQPLALTSTPVCVFSSSTGTQY